MWYDDEIKFVCMDIGRILSQNEFSLGMGQIYTVQTE